MWVVRNKSNDLALFIDMMPGRGNNDQFDGWWWSPTEAMGYQLDNKLFPELTWDDMPIEVDLIRHQ